jgi:hypothetical protein
MNTKETITYVIRNGYKRSIANNLHDKYFIHEDGDVLINTNDDIYPQDKYAVHSVKCEFFPLDQTLEPNLDYISIYDINEHYSEISQSQANLLLL